MNRKNRRLMEKKLRHSGFTKAQAKEYVNANYKEDPNPTATIKLSDGTERKIELDRKILENEEALTNTINQALEEETETKETE